MKIIKLSIFILLLIVVGTKQVSAQETGENDKQSRPFLGLSRTKYTPQTIFSVEPIFLSNRRLKLNLETQINHNPERYFMLTLGGYYFPEREEEEWQSHISGEDYFKKLNGYTIGAAYKQFLPRSCFYWFGGIGYNYYRVKYLAYDYYSYTEDGLLFYEYLGKDIKKDFHRISPNINIGIQWALNNYVFIDFYYGINYNYSFYSGKEVFADYEGFGYRGLSPNFGISIGILLKN